MSALSFKARVDSFYVPSHLCDPQIHLWCDTGWVFRGQPGSWSTHLQTYPQAFMEVWGSNPWPSVQQAQHCIPLGHSGSAKKTYLHKWIFQFESMRNNFLKEAMIKFAVTTVTILLRKQPKWYLIWFLVFGRKYFHQMVILDEYLLAFRLFMCFWLTLKTSTLVSCVALRRWI